MNFSARPRPTASLSLIGLVNGTRSLLQKDELLAKNAITTTLKFCVFAEMQTVAPRKPARSFLPFGMNLLNLELRTLLAELCTSRQQFCKTFPPFLPEPSFKRRPGARGTSYLLHIRCPDCDRLTLNLLMRNRALPKKRDCGLYGARRNSKYYFRNCDISPDLIAPVAQFLLHLVFPRSYFYQPIMPNNRS